MYIFFLNDDIFVSYIFSYLDCKDRYNLSNVNRLLSNLGKLYKKINNQKNEDIYIYISLRIKDNIERNLNMFLDFISLNDRIYVYDENLDDGIYYYSKNIYYKEYNSPRYYFPIVNFRSHNMYMIVFVKDKKHRTKIYKNYFSSLFVMEDPEMDKINYSFREKVLKLV